MKKEDYTPGQIDILKDLVRGGNIALYRNGSARLRDKEHNPLRNVRMDMFEKIREWLVQKDGLFFINPDMIKRLPMYIQNPMYIQKG